MLKHSSYNAADTAELGQNLARHIMPGTVIILSGDLGTGKTQLASAIARGLDITSPVTSPTFAIIKNYPQATPCHPQGGRIPLNHMDLYRLEDPAQLHDLDIWDITRPDEPSATLIEWGELFDDVVGMADLIISISMDEGSNLNYREIELRPRTECGQTLTCLTGAALAAGTLAAKKSVSEEPVGD